MARTTQRHVMRELNRRFGGDHDKAPGVSQEPVPLAPRPAVALALVSAALTAVLFLLVLLLVAGWSEEPLKAALAVTVIPAGALAGLVAAAQQRHFSG